VSLKDPFDLSVVLMQNAYKTMSLFADASRRMTFHCISLQIKLLTNTKFAAVMVFKTTVDGL